MGATGFARTPRLSARRTNGLGGIRAARPADRGPDGAVATLDPTLRISNLKEQIPLQRAEDLAELGDALRSAGVPET
jgi:hypothetical protein